MINPRIPARATFHQFHRKQLRGNSSTVIYPCKQCAILIYVFAQGLSRCQLRIEAQALRQDIHGIESPNTQFRAVTLRTDSRSKIRPALWSREFSMLFEYCYCKRGTTPYSGWAWLLRGGDNARLLCRGIEV